MGGEISQLLRVLQREEQGFLAELCPWLGLTSAFHGKPSLCLPGWLLAWVSAGVMDGGLDVTQARKPWSCTSGCAASPVAVCEGSIPCSSPGLSKGTSPLLPCFPRQPMRKPTVLGDN